jgi:hypothetical protein
MTRCALALRCGQRRIISGLEGGLAMEGTAQGKSWDFFVSYTREDVKHAEWIAWVLREAGYLVLIQKWNFTAGKNWPKLVPVRITSYKPRLRRGQPPGGG